MIENTPGEAFTVLLPVYSGDQADHFERAFRSVSVDQNRKPAQIVVVQDGPVAAPLAAVISNMCVLARAHSIAVVHHVIPQNVGLATALNLGLELSDHDIVARMDADDISLRERFATQLPMIESGLDLVGAGMLEFHNNAGEIVGQRTPRVGQETISRFARFHDPFSHPSVVYRRGAVVAAGGYLPLGQMEDYWLFARMILAGARVDNFPGPLVMYRVGAGAYARRGGFGQWKSELSLQMALRRIRFTSFGQFVRNVVLRGVYRFVPEPFRRYAYRRFIAGAPDS